MSTPSRRGEGHILILERGRRKSWVAVGLQKFIRLNLVNCMGVELPIDNTDRCLNYDPVGRHPTLAFNLTRAVRVS